MPTGLIIYDGPSRLPGAAPIVAILTGLDRPSSNEKTGDMPQLWILSSDEDPIHAKKSGGDSAVCGSCPLRDGRCYVNLLHGPNTIYRAYRAGKYQDGRALDSGAIRAAITNRLGRIRPIRLGAYGDPAALPIDVIERLCKASPVHAGYTHAWRDFPALRPYLMASCDSASDADEAHALGWRTFRVVSNPTEDKASAELWCPAAPEGGASRTCSTCGLCRGGERGPSIAIRAHGGAAPMSVWRAVERRRVETEHTAS